MESSIGIIPPLRDSLDYGSSIFIVCKLDRGRKNESGGALVCIAHDMKRKSPREPRKSGEFVSVGSSKRRRSWDNEEKSNLLMPVTTGLASSIDNVRSKSAVPCRILTKASHVVGRTLRDTISTRFVRTNVHDILTNDLTYWPIYTYDSFKSIVRPWSDIAAVSTLFPRQFSKLYVRSSVVAS